MNNSDEQKLYEHKETLETVTDTKELYKLYLETQEAYGFNPLPYEIWLSWRIKQ